MRKSSLVVASIVSALASILVLPAADAQRTGGTPPIDVNNTQVIEPGQFTWACPFPVQVQTSGKGGTIALPGGGFIFTSPGLDATLTNLNSGSSVTVNITGTFHQTTDTTGATTTIVTGRNLLGDPDAGFVVAIGSFSFKFAADGITLLQALSGTGQQIHVCPLIQ